MTGEDFRTNVAAGLQVAGLALVLIIAVLVCGFFEKLQYEDCLLIGHSKTYCMAETAGCFDGGRKR